MKHYITRLLALLNVFLFGTTLITKAEPDPNFHIYLCFGQSNMEGNATVPDEEKTGVSERFQLLYSAEDCNQCSRRKGQWSTATPPLARCFHWNNSGFGPVDYFGRTLVEKLDPSIKVGAVVVACGGADIQLFEKDNYKSYLNTCESWLKEFANSYGGNPYGRLIDMAKEAQKVGIIKGILVHQGESNTGQSNWPTRLNAVYKNILSDLGLNATDVPLLVGEVRYTGPCSSHNNIIRKVPDVIPTAHVVSAQDCEASSDQYHFSVAGYKLLGQRYAETMLELLGDNPVQQSGISVGTIVNQESEPGEVEINVNIDNDAINKVEIYADDKLISSNENSFTWSDVTRGTHTIWAVGYDASNNEYTSTKKEISIFEPQLPYNGSSAKIPGKIEAEEFDFGGEGNAYHDNDEQNRNGGDRNEGVDMSNTAVGYTQKGEWLEYTVEIEEDGEYIVESRVASGSDGSSFTLYLDNTFIIPGEDGTPGGFVEVPNTGDWETFTTVSTKLNKLSKGTHVLKLEITGDWVDIDYLNFKKASDSGNNGSTNDPEENITGKTGGTDYYINSRRVYVYAPANIKANRPLVISLHGMNQDIDYQKKQAQWELVADTANFTVAYPQSDGTTWDITGMTDLNHIKDIIAKMTADYKIDETRIYLSGFSMGGMTCYHAMNNMPDVFAAFAPVSGYKFGDKPSASTRAIPIFHTHGTSDDVVHYEPYQNQEGIEAVIEAWASHNKCTEKTTTMVNGTTRTAYSGGECEADVVLNAIPGKGHWHSNDTYHTTREIWKFISQYSTACGKSKPTMEISTDVLVDQEPGEVSISVKIVDEAIATVDILVDGKVVAKGKTTATVTDLGKGMHTITAIGYDENNGEYTSPEKVISIYEKQTPFNGTPSSIPGKIEAEEFDYGGEGNAYHDNDEENRNGDNTTRNEGIDLDGKAVGYNQKGEWMEYTVFVKESGTYEVQASVAGDNGTGSFKLYIDDKEITGEIVVPNTGDYKTFETVTTNVDLEYGEHVLKLEVTNDWFDIDYLNFVLKTATGIENVEATATNALNGEYEVYDVLGAYLGSVNVEGNNTGLKRGIYILRNAKTNSHKKVVITK